MEVPGRLSQVTFPDLWSARQCSPLLHEDISEITSLRQQGGAHPCRGPTGQG